MEKVSPAQWPEPRGHYSPGIISKGMLYVSGQLPVDPVTREVAAGGIEEQTRVALENVEQVLKQAGLSRERVVQCRVYVSGIDLWEPVNRAYAAFFGSHRPARTIVPVPALHFGCLVEIDVVAEMGE